MLFRSTGLGKTELVAQIDKAEGITRQGDYLVLHVVTLEPVRWKIRAAINYKDLLDVLRACLKSSIITFVLWPFRALRKPEHPGDF
jgi:hypothetical protein